MHVLCGVLCPLLLWGARVRCATRILLCNPSPPVLPLVLCSVLCPLVLLWVVCAFLLCALQGCVCCGFEQGSPACFLLGAVLQCRVSLVLCYLALGSCVLCRSVACRAFPWCGALCLVVQLLCVVPPSLPPRGCSWFCMVSCVLFCCSAVCVLRRCGGVLCLLPAWYRAGSLPLLCVVLSRLAMLCAMLSSVVPCSVLLSCTVLHCALVVRGAPHPWPLLLVLCCVFRLVVLQPDGLTCVLSRFLVLRRIVLCCWCSFLLSHFGTCCACILASSFAVARCAAFFCTRLCHADFSGLRCMVVLHTPPSPPAGFIPVLCGVLHLVFCCAVVCVVVYSAVCVVLCCAVLACLSLALWCCGVLCCLF